MYPDASLSLVSCSKASLVGLRGGLAERGGEVLELCYLRFEFLMQHVKQAG